MLPLQLFPASVEVRKQKYGIEKEGSLVPRLFLCGWGAMPIQETSGKYYRVAGGRVSLDPRTLRGQKGLGSRQG